MSSILKVDQLKDSGGNAIITSDGSGNITTGTGIGKVLQVTDQVIITSQQTLATTTFTDFTSATLNITPTSTSSKIFLQTNINCEHSTANSGYGLRFLRDTTDIFTTLQNYARFEVTAGVRSYSTFTFIDSPSSTSQITYKLQVQSHSSRTIKFQNSAQSTFYAMEIAG